MEVLIRGTCVPENSASIATKPGLNRRDTLLRSRGALHRLEPDEGKLSRPVLRGGSGSNVAPLPDHFGAHDNESQVSARASRRRAGWPNSKLKRQTKCSAGISRPNCAAQAGRRELVPIAPHTTFCFTMTPPLANRRK